MAEDTENDSETLLFKAIEDGDCSRVESILAEHSSLTNCLDKNGMTPLDQAAYRGNSDLCHLLILQGAKVNSNEHEHRYTSLFFAALSGDTKTVSLLLDAGADVDHTNTIGRTASQMAAFTGQHKVVALINSYFPKHYIEYFTKPHGFDTKGKIPDHLVKPIHGFILQSNIHPVRALMYIQNQPVLMESSTIVQKAFDLICEQQFKLKTPNDIACLRAHCLAFVVKSAAVGQQKFNSLMKKMIFVPAGETFSPYCDQFVRQSLRKFPFVDCQLFQMIVRKLSNDEEPTKVNAVAVLQAALNGQRYGEGENFCGTCGEPGASLRCKNCKMVYYCDRKCQKWHWFVHKKQCADLALQFEEHTPSQETAEVDADELSSAIQEQLGAIST